MTKLCILITMCGLVCSGCGNMKKNDKNMPELTLSPAPYKDFKETDAKLVIGRPVILQKDACSLDSHKKVFYKKAGIFCGDKALVERELLWTNWPQEEILYLKINDKIQGRLSLWGTSSASAGNGFGAKGKTKHKSKLEFDKKNKSFSYSRDFNLDKNGATGSYKHKVKLLLDGLVKVSFSYTAAKGKEKHIKSQKVCLNMPADRCAGIPFLLDGNKYAFPNNNLPLLDNKRTIFKGKVKSFVFNPDKPEKGFDIKFPHEYFMRIHDNRFNKNKNGKPGKPYFSIIIEPVDRKLSLLLDLRKVKACTLKSNSDDIQKGVDFWKADRLHVPNYRKCQNMIQNPSFEAGLRYYAYVDSMSKYNETEFGRYFTTDSTTAMFGNNSLKIRVSGFKPTPLGTFAIPVTPKKKHTVSGYIKSDKKGLYLSLGCVSGQWLVFPKIGRCKATKEWKRFSFSFIAPNNAVKIHLRGQYTGKLPEEEKGKLQGNIWVDGLQMEEGGLTNFKEKPLAAQLLTSNLDNFLQPKDKINARLKITSTPNTSGKVALEAQDYFYSKLWSGKFDFKTNEKGIAVVNLPLDGKLPKGIHVIRGNFEIGEFKDTDYFRISIMDFLKNKHRNKGITATGIWMNNPRAVDIARRNMKIGIGGTNILAFGAKSATLKRTNKHLEKIKMLDKFRIKNYSNALLCRKGRIFPAKGASVDVGEDTKKVTPEMLKYVEEASYEKAKYCYPLMDCWYFCSETTFWLKTLNAMDKMEDMAKLHLAAYRGVKKFNPNLKFMATGGPYNMSIRNGIVWLDRYLTTVGKIAPDVKFDIIGIHPYRTVPEEPDLDYEMKEFFKMIARHGYGDTPVILNEGIYYSPYIIPAWGLSAHKGCSADHYRTYCPSYHMGWGERISAAYWARSWLVGLKYQNRIKCMDGHQGWNFMDVNLTPLALQKIPNTLGRLLGNAYFKKDIRFAPNVRCYVFEDEKKCPVAAVWSHIKKVDKGLAKSPQAEIRFTDGTPQFFDLMEVERNVTPDSSGYCTIPISSFPLFIRGKAGSLKSFCKNLDNARLKGKEHLPVAIAINPVGMSKLEVQFRNLLSRPFFGNVIVSVQGKKKEKSLSLPAFQMENLELSLTQKLSEKQILDVSMPITLKERDRKPVDLDASFRGFAIKKHKGSPIKIDGNYNDWKMVPKIPITNRFIRPEPKLGVKKENIGYKNDCEATFQATWDDDFLYLLVKVKDDKLTLLKNKSGGEIWTCDSLQVYVDTYCDARKKIEKGFDTNDYNYDFGCDPEKPEKLLVWRSFTPEWQLTLQGGLKLLPMRFEPGIKTAFKKIKDGCIYEIAFPKAYLAPMEFKSGVAVGFGLSLNDNDGHSRPKASLTLTPEGTQCYQRPHLYPVMILTE